MRLRNLNTRVAGKFLAFHRSQGLNIGTVYMSERVDRTRDGIALTPDLAGCNRADADVYWTLKHIQAFGHRVLVLQVGYDGISNPTSLKLWLAFWVQQGLGMYFETYQYSANQYIAQHSYVATHMQQYDFGRVSRIYAARELASPAAYQVDVLTYWHLLGCITQGKLDVFSRWYNGSRNVLPIMM